MAQVSEGKESFINENNGGLFVLSFDLVVIVAILSCSLQELSDPI